jgi:signal transduction histidine kinase
MENPRDEIDLLRAELALEKERRITAEKAREATIDFLATLSHELRTPLQALVGYTDLLEGGVRGDLSPTQLEDLRRMQRSETHLLRVVNGVLDFMKLESGVGSDFQPRPFPVPEVLRGIHTLIAPQLDQKKHAFVSRYADPPPTAYADPAYTQHIVLNLLSNAIKFTPSQGTISVETDGDGDGAVVVRVRDTGPGIEPEMLEAIFEPFVQVRAPSSSGIRGTGLGLAISRRLARAMGGALTAESELGAGSTFILTLPEGASAS